MHRLAWFVVMSAACRPVPNITGAVPHCGDPGEDPCPVKPEEPRVAPEGDLQAKIQRVVDECRAPHPSTALAVWVSLDVETDGDVAHVTARNSDEAPALASEVAACITTKVASLRTSQRVEDGFHMDYAAEDTRPVERARAMITAWLQTSMRQCNYQSRWVTAKVTVTNGAFLEEVVVGGMDVPEEAKTCIGTALSNNRLAPDPFRKRVQLSISSDESN